MTNWRLSKAAADDIADIFVSGAEMFGLKQAELYHADLERMFNILGQNPMVARLRDDIVPPVRVHPFKAHIIIYEVSIDAIVRILRVRHGREDWHTAPLE